jgi:hypothetical protein
MIPSRGVFIFSDDDEEEEEELLEDARKGEVND